MSSAYAGRFGILPVQVTTREIVIATAEPFVREWVAELQPILRKEIRRVLANPDDISRYLVEFFNLARSVKKAAAKGEVTAGLSSFEQLVELAYCQRPAHRPHRRLAVAIRLRPACFGHPHRAAA